MATRIGSQDELTRLKRAREAADRAYNDALTLVDRALAPRPALPDPPRAFDQRQLNPVNEAWRVAPDVERLLGTGWKRRLRAWVWDLVGPIVERQQHFNGVLVDHLNRTAAVEVEGQQALTAVIAALAEYTGALEAFQSRLIQYVQQITPFVDTKNSEVASEVAGVSRTMMSALDGLGDEVRRRAEAAVAREQRFARHVDELRTTVGQVQHGLLAMRRRLEGAASGEAAPAAGAGTKADLDAAVDAYAYVGFENLYRGSRDEIRSRLVEYLPLFDGASDVLDVGCGRGEFLNLLRERDIRARGVDVNAEMVEESRARGLDASAGDALTHLDALEDESLGGLFAAQVVEHLQPDYLVRLLNVAGRKLRPGARIVLETINPRCWFAERPEPRVAGEVEHPQPARYEQDTGLGGHRKAGPLQHPTEDRPRVRLLEAVVVETQVVERRHEGRTQERVAAVRDADHGPAAGAQHAENLAQRAVGVVEVLDGPHRVDRVEAPGAERQRPDVAADAAQGKPGRGEAGAGIGDDGAGDVDPERVRPAPGGPAEDAGIPRLVPEVRLQHPAAGQVGELRPQQPLLVRAVLRGGAGAAQIGEVRADVGPEAAVARLAGGVARRDRRLTHRPSATRMIRRRSPTRANPTTRARSRACRARPAAARPSRRSTRGSRRRGDRAWPGPAPARGAAPDGIPPAPRPAWRRRRERAPTARRPRSGRRPAPAR